MTFNIDDEEEKRLQKRNFKNHSSCYVQLK